MFDFAETTKDMTSAEILNYYRNLYYAEPQVTERGIVANAINDYFAEVKRLAKDHDELLAWGGHIKSKDKALVREAVAREIFWEIEDVLNNIGYFDEIDFKALKKKYTEGNNDKS